MNDESGNTFFVPHVDSLAELFLQQRDAGLLVSTLCRLPARSARTVIKLLNGIDAASAAGLLRPGVAPIELNSLVADFHSDMVTLQLIAIVQADHAWTTERLTSRDINRLFAETWDQPFTTLETFEDVAFRTGG